MKTDVIHVGQQFSCRFINSKLSNRTKTVQSIEQPNDNAFELFVEATEQPAQYGIRNLQIGESKVLDFAVGRVGTLEAGVILSQICMGGLGQIELAGPIAGLGLPRVIVSTDSPLLACIGSQYAGWPISHERYFAMGSGPMRMPRGKEEVLVEYGLHRSSKYAIGVLETNQIPGEEVIKLIAAECEVEPCNVCVCVARTASWPGAVQVVARSIEVAMHKLHELKFDLSKIINGAGSAPIPPLADNDMQALGWTNDSILYGARVELTVDTTDESIEKIADQIPSCSSAEFGTPFLDIFNKYDKDFYKIDKMLFSPANVVITNRSTGRIFQVGEIRNDVLKQSFGIE